MRTFPASLLVAASIGLVPFVAGDASAQSRKDQQSVRTHMQAGRVMSSREIERRIIPQMRDNEYLGFEYDGVATAYRLKFIKDGQVVWVDVDARTARVLRVSR